MKTIRNLFILAAMTVSITACTQDDGWQTGADQVIAATVQTPVEGWGTLSRALPSGYSDLTLHYTAAKNEVLTSYSVSESGITSSNGNSFDFVTKGTSQLVWAEVKESTPFYLLVSHDEDGAYWASVTPATHPQDSLAFELKPRYAKLTVQATITGGVSVAVGDIECSLDYYNADNTTPVTVQPMNHGTTKETWEPTFSSSDNNIYTASTVFAPQALTDETKVLTFTVCGQTYTLDLETVTVDRDSGAPTSRDEANGIYAVGTTFGYNVGEHITLAVTLNLQALTPGAITVTDFTAASNSYTQELNGSVISTNP